MSKSPTKGIIYITAGASFTRLALASAESAKQHSPNIRVHLFSDQPDVQSPWIDGLSLIENPHVRSKVDYIHQTPFDYTLFLDADTRIISDIHSLFDVLKRFDLAIAHAQKRNHFPTQQKWTEDIPYAFPQMNSGVLLFRKNEKSIQLLKDWQQAYHNNGFWKDQVTLRELIWKSDLRISILPPEFNIRFAKYLDVWTEKEAAPQILHYAKFKEDFNASYQEAKGKIQTRRQHWQAKWIKLKWIWQELKSLV
ncbi:MAG: putative nucleotide-diphospho-sugar transferase [Bacteroidota bacterium]